MKSPLVTIVVPVYNMSEFLEETILSITSSHYQNLEIVVVDDGSQDDSLEVAKRCAQGDSRIKVLSQPNSGVCVARNNAVAHAHGEYVLPVDSDDLIAPEFVEEAVRVMECNPEVKVVSPTVMRFGKKSGILELPAFSLSKLAVHNSLVASSMYRRADFDRVHGYCVDIQGREDWEFWISLLKDGGEVVRLPSVGLYYRIRPNSKRVQDRERIRQVVDTLNRRHPEFFQHYLGGPLHYRKSWSKAINRVRRIGRKLF